MGDAGGDPAAPCKGVARVCACVRACTCRLKRSSRHNSQGPPQQESPRRQEPGVVLGTGGREADSARSWAQKLPCARPWGPLSVVMRPEGVGTLLIKGPRGGSRRPEAAARMQPRMQPLAQALPFSFRRVLRDTGLRVPVMKVGTGWEGLQQTLKEVAYILLCCWCIKELLD